MVQCKAAAHFGQLHRGNNGNQDFEYFTAEIAVFGHFGTAAKAGCKACHHELAPTTGL
jgi:hypothetical protein